MPITTTTEETVDWDAFHDAVNAIPVRDVLAALGVDVGPLEGGQDAHVYCPAHVDRDTPSLYVHQDENWAYCFGACHRGYSPVSLYAKTLHRPIIDAFDELGRMFGITPDDPRLKITPRSKPVVHEPEPTTLPALLGPEKAQRYVDQMQVEDYVFLEREWGVPRWVSERFGLGHTPRGDFPPAWTIPVWDADVGQGLITIRFRRDDAVLPGAEADLIKVDAALAAGAAGRVLQAKKKRLQFALRSKYWGVRGRNHLYPFGLWNLAIENDWVLVTESEKTVLLLSAYGLPAITLTGGVRGHPAEWRRSWRHLLDPYDWWVVWFDDDDAGELAYVEMERAFPDRVLRFPWPDVAWGGDDPVDFCMKFGLDQVLARVEGVVRRAEHGEIALPDQLPSWRERRRWFGWDCTPMKWDA